MGLRYFQTDIWCADVLISHPNLQPLSCVYNVHGPGETLPKNLIHNISHNVLDILLLPYAAALLWMFRNVASLIATNHPCKD